MMNRTLARSLFALPLLLGVHEASAQSTLRVHVSDAVSGVAPKAVKVKVVDSGGEHLGVTDEHGAVDFTGLFPASAPESVPFPSLVLETSAHGYLPLRKEIHVGPEGWQAQLALVPRKSGHTTPVIRAAEGGKFTLPNIGLLCVEPGALEQDARLQLSVIPSAAMSSSMVEGQLQYEVSCLALDSNGYPQRGTLSLVPGGVTLSVTLPRWGDPVEELTSETWSTSSFDESWQLLATTPVHPVERGAEVAVVIPLVEGFNLLERDYRTAPTAGGCEWGPWKVQVALVGTTAMLGGQGQSVFRGRYTEHDCIAVGEGQERFTSWDVGNEVEQETSLSADALLASVSEKVGVQVSGSYDAGKVKSTTTAKERCSKSGQLIHGDSSLTHPWSCVSGEMEMTQSLSSYQVWASRTCVQADGSTSSESVPAGVMELPGPIVNVWDVSIDETCGECATYSSQELPPDLPR